ncbi:MAG: hypothetical protein OXL37_13195 [Chloroflexota bacterium]|nr:hypothetical protein [Chloroflexota bacterium]MDE2959211.1 hypothetical protein [Chloroflexota bacterium]
MTITIDPITISTLAILPGMAVGLTVWLARRGQRASRLETDVGELKTDIGELKHGQQEIKDLLHRTNEVVVALMNHRHNAQDEPTFALPAD